MNKTMLPLLALNLLLAMPVYAGHAGPGMANDTVTIEHGGGCRKSSPPGQCCHMDHKTGLVHCH